MQTQGSFGLLSFFSKNPNLIDKHWPLDVILIFLKYFIIDLVFFFFNFFFFIINLHNNANIVVVVFFYNHNQPLTITINNIINICKGVLDTVFDFLTGVTRGCYRNPRGPSPILYKHVTNLYVFYDFTKKLNWC